MKKKDEENLKKNGWRVGDIDEFLELSKEEVAFIDMKTALAKYIIQKRKDKKFTQKELSKLINSSQSRIAKIEKAEQSVSFDLMIRALLSMGTTRKEIAKVIC